MSAIPTAIRSVRVKSPYQMGDGGSLVWVQIVEDRAEERTVVQGVVQAVGVAIPITLTTEVNRNRLRTMPHHLLPRGEKTVTRMAALLRRSEGCQVLAPLWKAILVL